MNSRIFSGFLAVIVVAGIAFAAAPASAVTLIPPSIEFTDVEPGETIASKIKLFNETASPMTLYAETANFESLDESGTPNILIDQQPEGLATWIDVLEGPYELKAGERVEVPIEIDVPADAPPGGHYASVLFSPSTPASRRGGQVNIGQMIGTLVLVRVKGEVVEQGSIQEFATVPTGVTLTRLPIEFLIRFQNSGNVHLRPTGTIVIKNLFGTTVENIPVNSGLGAVLPGSTRRFDAVWEKQPNASVKGTFFQELSREWKDFAFGSYSASVALTYGQSEALSDQVTLKFWVLPWRLLTVVLLIIAVLVLAIIFGIRHYNRWIVSRAESKGKF